MAEDILIDDELDSGFSYTPPISDLIEKIYDNQSILNRCSNLLNRDNIELGSENIYNILESLDQSLSNLNQLSIKIDKIEDELEIEDDDTITTLPISSDYRYSIGETCLLLDPFDNYRVFTLFPSHTSKDALSLDGTQKLYLVFKNGSKEIRIPEYSNFNSTYVNIDKGKGQVLFKITKKHVAEIYTLKNRTFYITRIYETMDYNTNTLISSDEEVLFSGYWNDRTSAKETTLQETIEGLKDLLQQKEAALQAMLDSINQLTTQNVDLTERLNILQEQYEKLVKLVEENAPGLLDDDDNSELDSYVGEILDASTILVNYENVDDPKIKEQLDILTQSGEYIRK